MVPSRSGVSRQFPMPLGRTHAHENDSRTGVFRAASVSERMVRSHPLPDGRGSDRRYFRNSHPCTCGAPMRMKNGRYRYRDRNGNRCRSFHRSFDFDPDHSDTDPDVLGFGAIFGTETSYGSMLLGTSRILSCLGGTRPSPMDHSPLSKSAILLLPLMSNTVEAAPK